MQIITWEDFEYFNRLKDKKTIFENFCLDFFREIENVTDDLIFIDPNNPWIETSPIKNWKIWFQAKYSLSPRQLFKKSLTQKKLTEYPNLKKIYCFTNWSLVYTSLKKELELSNPWKEFSIFNGETLLAEVQKSKYQKLHCSYFWITSIDQKNKYQTLKEASHDIKRLLDENERIFLEHGPNSWFGNTAKLKDASMLKARYSARLTVIKPNNNKIYDILNNILKNEPDEKLISNKMKSHIEAFNQHLEDGEYDYTEHQFPISFKHIINKYFYWWIQKENYQNYTDRLSKKLHWSVMITERYIFWSSIYTKESNDVDILLYHNGILTTEDYELIKVLKMDFKWVFVKNIEIYVFDKREIKNYLLFKEKALDIISF